MKKRDIWYSLLIGELSALLLLFLTKVLDLNPLIVKMVDWFPIFLPLLSLGGVYFISLLGKKWKMIYQLGKNFLVGILNTLIDLSVLNFFMAIFSFTRGWPYALFKTLSFLTATTNSYFWNKFWTFEKGSSFQKKEARQFFTVALGGLLINVTVSSFVVNVVATHFGFQGQIWGTVGGMVAALTGFLWDFFGYKLLVFEK